MLSIMLSFNGCLVIFFFASFAPINHTLYPRGHDVSLKKRQHVSKNVTITANHIPIKESHAQEREGHCVQRKLATRERHTKKERERRLDKDTGKP